MEIFGVTFGPMCSIHFSKASAGGSWAGHLSQVPKRSNRFAVVKFRANQREAWRSLKTDIFEKWTTSRMYLQFIIDCVTWGRLNPKLFYLYLYNKLETSSTCKLQTSSNLPLGGLCFLLQLGPIGIRTRSSSAGNSKRRAKVNTSRFASWSQRSAVSHGCWIYAGFHFQEVVA